MTAVTMKDFITEVKTRGMARSNRYTAWVPLPGDTARLAMMFCESATLPGISVATQGHRINGELREYPYERMFDPITLSFYSDSGLQIKSAFDTWHQSIIDPVTRNINYYNQYTRDMIIEVLDLQDLTVYAIKLFEVYPKTISPLQLSYSDKEPMRFSVTLQYKYWEHAVAMVTTPRSNTNPGGLQDPSGVNTTTGSSAFMGGDLTWDSFSIPNGSSASTNGFGVGGSGIPSDIISAAGTKLGAIYEMGSSALQSATQVYNTVNQVRGVVDQVRAVGTLTPSKISDFFLKF